MKRLYLSTLVLTALALSASAPAALFFNEIMLNPPGGDNGLEFIELRSTIPNFDMSGLHLLILEGDGTSGIRGTIDQALPLTGFSTGSNGLFLWRDSSVVLSPPPAPATTIRVQDFVPDIENGGNTLLIVSGFTGFVGQDLDADNDDLLDFFPWTSVLDGFGYSEDLPNALSATYALQLGLPFFPQQEWTPDAFARVGNALYAFDVLGNNPGPYVMDPLEAYPAYLPDFYLTPGSENIPEPASLLLIALVGLTLRRRG
ncbi:MAG: hypothetical protein IPM13_16125 [Phycisphaerales bacterium]|nr:hypothetical protein [Phycisphaerales bacterium]